MTPKGHAALRVGDKLRHPDGLEGVVIMFSTGPELKAEGYAALADLSLAVLKMSDGRQFHLFSDECLLWEQVTPLSERVNALWDGALSP